MPKRDSRFPSRINVYISIDLRERLERAAKSLRRGAGYPGARGDGTRHQGRDRSGTERSGAAGVNESGKASAEVAWEGGERVSVVQAVSRRQGRAVDVGWRSQIVSAGRLYCWPRVASRIANSSGGDASLSTAAKTTISGAAAGLCPIADPLKGLCQQPLRLPPV